MFLKVSRASSHVSNKRIDWYIRSSNTTAPDSSTLARNASTFFWILGARPSAKSSSLFSAPAGTFCRSISSRNSRPEESCGPGGFLKPTIS